MKYHTYIVTFPDGKEIRLYGFTIQEALNESGYREDVLPVISFCQVN